MFKFPLNLEPGVIIVNALVSSGTKQLMLRLALDTGATYTQIPLKVALALGCELTTEKIEIVTASGIEYVPIATLATVECLSYKVPNLKVVCHDLPPKSPVEGLLGLNFLKHFNLSLKFLQKILEINK